MCKNVIKIHKDKYSKHFIKKCTYGKELEITCLEKSLFKILFDSVVIKLELKFSQTTER